ncbi:MAG TPA: N-acetylneuraminate synthase family protein [Candidatus Paceibacterota bacterium]|nr:N-acetylneuraminate synthase family protein [Candidatus Paceibacterota bacterium]
MTKRRESEGIKKGLFIMCRMSSARFPKKALARVAGQTVLEHVIDRAKMTPDIDVLAVCTSVEEQDNVIESIAKARGVKVFRGSLDDFLGRLLGAANSFGVDVFAVWTADNLFCEPAFVSQGLRQMTQERLDFLDLPDELIPGSASYCISTAALRSLSKIIPTRNTEPFPTLFKEYGSFTIGDLRVKDKVYHYPNVRVTLDYPEDLDFIRTISHELKMKPAAISLYDIVKLVKKKPDIAQINLFRNKDWAVKQARQRTLIREPSSGTIREMHIGGRAVGDGHPAYIIAEIGLNHQGDVNLAKKLIDHAVAAGADCVKFQKRSLKHVYRSDILASMSKEEHGSNYILHHVKRTELSENQMRRLHRYTVSQGVDFLCTPWDEKSLKFLATLHLPAYKIGSPDMTNIRLIRRVAKLKKPLIISTGMSFLSEIERLMTYLDEMDVDYALLHCNSTYPAPYHDLNLNFIRTLQGKCGRVIGYSGHEAGISACIAAVTFGAKIIEKHITLDRNLPGPDHRASLEPEQFASLVREIRATEAALGDGARYPTRGEYLNRQFLSKSIVASRDLPKGTIIRAADMEVRGPGKGTSPLKIDTFIGRRILNRDIKRHDYIFDSDIDFSLAAMHEEFYRPSSIHHAWGMVARMSDIETMLYARPDFFEIHLTDGDIREPKKYSKHYPFPITVHAPEYNGEKLLDLSSLDESLRRESVAHANRVITYARTLKPLFKNSNSRPLFILHPGGMDVDMPLTEQIPNLNRQLARSLRELDARGFEILVENMPPCPWYFGGQWWHSSFMDAGEIVQFSRKTGYGVTFDVSHAALYCNYTGKDLEEYTKTILPVTRYIHISDAARFNGEGLGIGDGSVDFKRILPHLVKTKLWFLPEIWQGHKFGGEGYLLAIKRLKDINGNF